MKTLTGTEKQVSWAIEIRKDILIAIDKLSADDLDVLDAKEVDKEKLREHLVNVDKAEFFIDYNFCRKNALPLFDDILSGRCK